MRLLLIFFFSLSTLSASEISLRLLTPDRLPTTQSHASFKVIMTNHSSEDQLLSCRLHTPPTWEELSSPSQLFYLPPNTARIVPLTLRIPPHTAEGTYRIAIGIAEADSEALIACEQLLLVVQN